MALSLLQTIKFGFGYLILFTIWQIPLPYISPTYLEMFLLSAGYAGVSLYLVLTNRTLEIGRYLTVVVIYIIAKIMWPIATLLILENDILSQETARNFAAFGYLVILLTGMVWASRVYKEKQYVQVFREVSRW
jgi:hypothetical protein